MPAVRKTRKKLRISQRQMLVAQMWEANKDIQQDEIVERLEADYGIKVSRHTITKDMKALKRNHWHNSAAAMNAIRERQREELQFIYDEAIAAWLKSLTDKEVKVFESTEGGLEQKLKAVERTEGQSGNPALLAQARGALKDIGNLYGTDAPKRSETDITSDGESIVKVLKGVSMDDL